MYLKNSNFAIYLALAALVGFGVSFAFNAESGLLNGDISKASRYNNQKVDPESTLIEEKLRADSLFLNDTRFTVDVLKNRVATLEELTSTTLEICKDVPELQANVLAMTSLNAKAYNTGKDFDAMDDCLSRITDGKSAPEYEQSSNNAFVGFQKIENQLGAGKDFVESAIKYLDETEPENAQDISDLMTAWTIYCAQDAILTGDEEDDYWENKVDANLASAGASVSGTLADKVNLYQQTVSGSRIGSSWQNTLHTITGSPVISNSEVLSIVAGGSQLIYAVQKHLATAAPGTSFLNNVQKQLLMPAGAIPGLNNSFSNTQQVYSPSKNLGKTDVGKYVEKGTVSAYVR